MCKAFSCIVTKDNKVYWKAGTDSHDALISDAKIKDDTTDGDVIKFAKIEITPDKGYLYPEDKWTLRVDENTTPRWLTKTKKDLCWVAFGEWKKQIYSGVNLKEAITPIHPLKIKSGRVTESDKDLLKKWASVRASVRGSVCTSVWASVWGSVRASVWASVWASVRDSVWASVDTSVSDSVGAYIGSLFPNIVEWQYAPKSDGYPFQPCVDLWKRGFVPSFDGTTWRLHSGKDAKIVYEWKPTEAKTNKAVKK